MGNPFQPVNPNLPYQQMPTPEVINSTNNFGNTIPGQVNQMTDGMPQTIGSSPSQISPVNQSIPGATFNQVNSEPSIDSLNQQPILNQNTNQVNPTNISSLPQDNQGI